MTQAFPHIANPERFIQKVSFAGMNIGRIYPTDIDCSFDYWSNFKRNFVFIEAKHITRSFDGGQRYHLEYLAAAIYKGENRAVVICAEHDTDSNENVYLHGCNVRCFIDTSSEFCCTWQTPEQPINVRDFINHTLKVTMK
jgi:hypothetical protein